MKKALIIISAVAVLFVCSSSALGLGVYIGLANADKYSQSNGSSSSASSSAESSAPNDPIYITGEKDNNLSYLPSDLSADAKQDLLEGYNDHFVVSYDVTQEAKYKAFFGLYEEMFQINIENARRQLEGVFGVPQDMKISITVTDSLSKFRDYSYLIWPDGTKFAGIVDGETNKMYLLLTQDYIIEQEELIDLVAHEMVHVFQNLVSPEITYYDWPPRWFDEGMADHFRTGDHTLPMDPGDNIPQTLGGLEDSFSGYSDLELNSVYNYAAIFYSYLEEKYGREALIAVYDDVDEGYFDNIYEQHFGIAPDLEYNNWLEQYD